MITVNEIYVQYGDRILLNKINLVIGERDRVGLVGRNGAGKSTLLKLIAGYQRPDSGNISRPTNSTLGFLHQEMTLPRGRTVMDETLTAFDEVKKMEARINALHEEMETRTDYESDAYHNLIDEYTTLNDRFALIGGITMQADAERVLKGLGFKQKDFDRLTDEFSGGWQMRIELAKMLLQKPDFLLLDEPTNHLDIESIIWLEDFLQDYPGAIIVISHDKQFLDNITKRTIEVELGRVFDYKAAYSAYVDLRADRREKLQAAYENQQRVIADKERTINRFMAKANKTRMAQSMQKQLDKMDRIELDEADVAAMNLRFPPAPRAGAVVAEARGLSKRYDSLAVLDQVDFKIERGERVAFVGQNGQGKTTLAKIIVGQQPATGGDLQFGHNIQIGYYAQNQSDTLDGKMTLLETMEKFSPPEMRTKLRAILGAFLFSGEDVDKKVSVLSGGERARLALACLLLRPFNLLVLDEPTNHLDIISKDVLKEAIRSYDGALIVVSHDREFLAGLTDRTLEFRDRQLFNYLGDVNFFLEKRALDNMRDIEKGGYAPAAPTVPETPADPLSYEERKRLQRAVSNAERKIEQLEAAIAKLETRMAEPDFYTSPDLDKITTEHTAKKTELAAAMEEWELAQMELEG